MINYGDKLIKGMCNIFEYVFEDYTNKMINNNEKERKITITKNENTGKVYIKKIVVQEVTEEEFNKEMEKTKKQGVKWQI